MKGFILSLVIFAVYAVTCMTLSHCFKPKRHSSLFFPVMLVFTPIYIIAFITTPPSLYVLPEHWQVSPAWMDLTYGLVVFVLNCHSFADMFFGFNGGFTTSLFYELLRSKKPLTTDDIIKAYQTDTGEDKIYAWRIPYLVDKGYLTMESGKTYTLTPKGHVIAKLTIFFKRVMNLGEGG